MTYSLTTLQEIDQGKHARLKKGDVALEGVVKTLTIEQGRRKHLIPVGMSDEEGIPIRAMLNEGWQLYVRRDPVPHTPGLYVIGGRLWVRVPDNQAYRGNVWVAWDDRFHTLNSDWLTRGGIKLVTAFPEGVTLENLSRR